jgi:hypothetical protein
MRRRDAGGEYRQPQKEPPTINCRRPAYDLIGLHVNLHVELICVMAGDHAGHTPS